MALTTCKECKKEVSTEAKTCPHCGVREPAVTEKSKLRSALVFAALVGGCVAIASTTGRTPEERAAASAECRKDLRCWAEDHIIAATAACTPHIERAAKYSHEWSNGALESKMAGSRGSSEERGDVTYHGDRVRFQNGFGAWQNIIYECDYSADTGAVLAVRVREGKI